MPGTVGRGGMGSMGQRSGTRAPAAEAPPPGETAGQSVGLLLALTKAE